MKILQINTALNRGSTGRIAEQIGAMIQRNGEDSYIAFSRPGLPSTSLPVQIGDQQDVYKHVLLTRLFDRHGFGSKKATKRFIEEIVIMDPDLIHLHNIHGYYLHIGILFDFLKEFNKPVVWTFHDCWPFTGHCTHFENINCMKWKTGCFSCEKIKSYPKSWFIDNSESNYKKKIDLFNSINNLTIVSPSNWLTNYVKQSFFKNQDSITINNGIDLNVFKPLTSNKIFNKHKIDRNKILVLGVASIWEKHRGLEDFIELNKKLDDKFQIILVGLSKKQISNLPSHIIGLQRTENFEELVSLYSNANIYLNPTYSDNFPTTNIEALACGTPVITYDTGGSPEAIDDNTGMVVKKGDILGLKIAIETIVKDENLFTMDVCKARAEKYFNKDDRFMDYFRLYRKLIKEDATKI